MSTAWMDSALCAQSDPEIFFPDRNETETRALELCYRCPVITQCAQYTASVEASISDVSYGMTGVWAGTTNAQRKRARKEHRHA